jgi:hypothetical protein
VTTISHEPLKGVEARPTLVAVLSITQMWASLAIIVMWLAVLFTAIYSPDIVTNGVAGDSSKIPAAVAVALFAFLATWPVAKYGFARDDRRDR